MTTRKGEGPLKQYSYDLPKELIRSKPLAERDQSRLFVFNTKNLEITFDVFKNIDKYLKPKSSMVLNDTGVIPARVSFIKDTGGVIEALVLFNEGFDSEGAVPIIVGKQLFPGRHLFIDGHSFLITRQVEQKFYIKPEFDKSILSDLLIKHGETPTPYYLGNTGLDEKELRIRYQTIFSKDKKSVAAPTASLHFTEEIFNSLNKREIERVNITLDVGLGTFQEVEDKNVKEKFLHEEYYRIDAHNVAKIKHAKISGRPIIAVGTTVVRALESSADRFFSEYNSDINDKTNIFIMPQYDFRVVDHLITNFHVPESSLMALVDAFIGYKQKINEIPLNKRKNIIDLYKVAISNGFNFYSFGDSMLIL